MSSKLGIHGLFHHSQPHTRLDSSVRGSLLNPMKANQLKHESELKKLLPEINKTDQSELVINEKAVDVPSDSSNSLPNPRPSTSNRPSLERKVAFEEVEDEGSNLKIPDPMTQIQVKIAVKMLKTAVQKSILVNY